MEIAKATCLEFLQSRFPSQTFQMILGFSSFITSLKYFPNAEKPTINGLYNCKRITNNTKFPNSIQVFSQNRALGYIPKDLALHLVPYLDGFLDSRILLCFCSKSPTQF